jgi:hypothetical protein
MSSLELWRCPATGVTAQWNKGAAFTVFVPERTDAHGITHGATSRHSTEQAAVRSAKRKARALREATAAALNRWARRGFYVRCANGRAHGRADGGPRVMDLLPTQRGFYSSR